MLTLNTVLTVLIILFIHWIADFVMQTDKQATGKSENLEDLFSHVLNYSLVWLLAGLLYGIVMGFVGVPFSLLLPIIFFIMTFICHFATDYVTSRINKRLWKSGMENKSLHNFFVSIGFDQWLHYTQLLLTYCFLNKYA